jgi:hypothetical protein
VNFGVKLHEVLYGSVIGIVNSGYFDLKPTVMGLQCLMAAAVVAMSLLGGPYDCNASYVASSLLARHPV